MKVATRAMLIALVGAVVGVALVVLLDRTDANPSIAAVALLGVAAGVGLAVALLIEPPSPPDRRHD